MIKDKDALNKSKEKLNRSKVSAGSDDNMILAGLEIKDEEPKERTRINRR